MKRITYLLILILFFCTTIGCISTWSTKSKILYGSLVALHTIDQLQTQYILKNDKYYEINPVINAINDRFGSDAVHAYFIAGDVVVYFLSDFLSESNRQYILGILNGLQLIVVSRNYGLGVKFSF